MVAANRTPRRSLGERVPARSAASGQMLDHLIHLLDRQKAATRARVAGLGAWVAIGALALSRALSFPPVGRGRQRGVVGVAARLADLLLESLHPALKALDLVGQCQEHLDAGVAAGVVDRLGLGAIHVAKVRRARRRACLCQPRSPRCGPSGPTERLRVFCCQDRIRYEFAVQISSLYVGQLGWPGHVERSRRDARSWPFTQSAPPAGRCSSVGLLVERAVEHLFSRSPVHF